MRGVLKSESSPSLRQTQTQTGSRTGQQPGREAASYRSTANLLSWLDLRMAAKEKDVLLSAQVQSALGGVAKRHGLEKPRFEVSPATKAGDNYMGLLYRVLLTEEAGPADQDLSLIVKTTPSSRAHREQMQSTAYFLNEIYMYRTVLPAFAELLRARGMLKDGQCPNTPGCLDVRMEQGGEEMTLILEVMRPLGYVMHDRKKGMDAAHLRLVLRRLARLHAYSLAMEQLQPERFARLRAGLTGNFFSPDNPAVDSLNQVALNACDMIKERFPENSDEYKKARKVLEDAMGAFRQAMQPDPEGGNVIVHGDCWTNNLLFKYIGAGAEHPEPEEVCFLDFQMCTYGPVVADVLCLLYVCSERPVRLQHGEALLRDYHAHLTARVDELLGAAGSGSGARLYSWDAMQRQLKRNGSGIFCAAVIFLPVIMAESEELPDLESGFNDESADNAFNMFTVEGRNLQRDNRMSDVLQDMLDLGYM